jgi:hypothetical protein
VAAFFEGVRVVELGGVNRWPICLAASPERWRSLLASSSMVEHADRVPDRVEEVVMRSAAATVGSYIDEQPNDWQPTLKKLRAACRRELTGYTEGMANGMPAYSRAGQVEVAFANQARYLSLYILKHPVFEAHRADLAGLGLGKGCIRYRRPDQINWTVVASLLAETRESASDIC